MSGIPEKLRDGWRRTYEETPYRDLPWFSTQPFHALRRAVREHWLPRGSRTLDIGCGAGTNALFLARSGFRAHGVDLAPGAVAAAQRRARASRLSVDFRVGDALRLPFPARSFEGLTDVGCFHTIPIELRAAYAREIARVLPPGGRFLLCWVAREFTAARGPPHRPSVEEVAGVFEDRFLFRWTEHSSGRAGRIPSYAALLERRRRPQPPAR